MREDIKQWLEKHGFAPTISDKEWTKETAYGCMKCHRSGLKPVITVLLDNEEGTYVFSLKAENRNKNWVELNIFGQQDDIKKKGIEHEMRLVGGWREFC